MINYVDESTAFGNIISAFSIIENDESLKGNIQIVVKVLESHISQLNLLVKDVVDAQNISEIPLSCEKALATFLQVRECYAELQQFVPNHQYYRFHDLWRSSTQRLICIAALVTYLKTEQFLDIASAASYLGVHSSPSEGFHVDLSSYFLGLLMFAEKLARLCTNLVVHGNYEMPLKIASFLSELRDGFCQLNFKNDIVRRKYDALKYHVKFTMEISIDLAMHGLNESSLHMLKK